MTPPEEILIKPPKSEPTPEPWLVVAKNRRVNRDWSDLISRYPENARRCYQYLVNLPMQRQPGRVFPLRGKKYKGAWEYEVSKGDRVFYVPDPRQHKVVVYYAGKHPKNAAPFP